MKLEVRSSRFEVQGSRFKVPGSGLRVPLHALRSTLHAPRAFTLLELLVVIAIIGILAGLALPTMNSFKPNVTASAERQLLDDLARARQLAISQRTTNYMVFVPTNFWNDPAYATLSPSNQLRADRLLDKQQIGYAFVTLRSLGDQPGQPTVRYLSEWKTLPEGSFIHPAKFLPIYPVATVITLFTNVGGSPVRAFDIPNFHWTRAVPFPCETAERSPQGYVGLPYIAFDHMGRLVTGGDELIPLGKGSVAFSRDPNTKAALQKLPSVTEMPVGNTSNSFNLALVDQLTGRARIEHQPIQ